MHKNHNRKFETTLLVIMVTTTRLFKFLALSLGPDSEVKNLNLNQKNLRMMSKEDVKNYHKKTLKKLVENEDSVSLQTWPGCLLNSVSWTYRVELTELNTELADHNRWAGLECGVLQQPSEKREILSENRLCGRVCACLIEHRQKNESNLLIHR